MLALLLAFSVFTAPALSWPIAYDEPMANMVEPALQQPTETSSPFPPLYQGDIMLTPEQLRMMAAESTMNGDMRRGAGMVFIKKWNKNQPIGFAFNASMSEKARKIIRESLAKITEKTCINFKEDSAVGTQLLFTRGANKCASNLGEYQSLPGKQQIYIEGGGCETLPSVTHEVFHALGVDHTQNRKDRDTFIKLNLDNVPAEYHHNFIKLTDAANNNFDVPYEYGSAMHYAAGEFASALGKLVIEPKQADMLNTIGKQDRVTFNDYKMINRLYDCSSHCPRQMACQNGGYPSPKDCNACICHDFYTGANCQTPKNLISLTASMTTGKTTFHQDQNNALFNNMDPEKFGRDTPKIIRAPEGRKIRVTFTNIEINNGKLKCKVAGEPIVLEKFGIEIVDNPTGDTTTIGKIFACPEKMGNSFVSQSNVLGYKAYIAPGMAVDSEVTYTLV